MYHYEGHVFVYNGGPGRISINTVGWIAREGTRVEAFSPRGERTLEPGDPELRSSASASKLVEAADRHGGLVEMFVELADSEKRRRRKLPPEWIGEVRELAARPITRRH